MKKYNELDSLGRKARDEEHKLRCDECPNYHTSYYPCSPTLMEACDYIFLKAFRLGYNRRKKDEKAMREKATKRLFNDFNNIDK